MEGKICWELWELIYLKGQLEFGGRLVILSCSVCPNGSKEISLALPPWRCDIRFRVLVMRKKFALSPRSRSSPVRIHAHVTAYPPKVSLQRERAMPAPHLEEDDNPCNQIRNSPTLGCNEGYPPPGLFVQMIRLTALWERDQD